ncbi:hypothetical protein ACFL3D_00050 [Candidatus Omnitrophota bacterium]
MHAQRSEKRKKLGEILVEMGIISNEQVQAALKVQKKEGGLLGAIFIKLQFVSESDIAIALAKQDSIPYLPAQNCVINASTLKLIDPSFALKNKCIPIDKIENTILLIIADPTQYMLIEELEQTTGMAIQVFVGLEQEIKLAIKKYYKISEDNALEEEEEDKE